jgi:hypothetical protein
MWGWRWRMNIKSVIPAPNEVFREALIVVAGAALAALVVSMWPQYKEFIKDSWRDN